MLMSKSSTESKARAPGGIVFMPPGASFGSDTRHAILEIKGAISSMVAAPLPGALLVRGNSTDPVDDHHLTIHDNLMVHLKSAAATIELAPAGVVDGALVSDVIHLVTVAAAPPGSTEPHVGRHQSKWEGAFAAFSLAPDDKYDPVTTRLVVDVWATKREFAAPGRLPAQWPGVRPAVSNSGTTVLGPVPAEWAFRREPRPDCVFYCRCWYLESLEYGGAPLITAPTTRQFSTEELLAFARKPLTYDIRGSGPAVTLTFGQFTFRLSVDEARALATTIENASPIEVDGVSVIPVAVANGKMLFHLPPDEAAKVPGFLRSASEAALK
ncbi:MAG TPA: hypothetical protein VN947_10790 [Polyangia bacterium]|nr:hypothetical protein [Polyangia bacterium]